MRIELEQEEDGRWIAEAPELPGVLVYGQTRQEAVNKAQALALRSRRVIRHRGALMGEIERSAHCGKHGTATATFVCQHLVGGRGLGFYCADDPDDSHPDAWCGRCEEVRIREGGEWNDVSEAFAKVTLICHFCYEAARERNIAS